MKTLTVKCCDFQVHSPRDQKYKAWPEKLMTLEGLRAWAEELLKQCKAKGIDCVAVTDHHDLIPGLLALSVSYETKSPIWVIPGMEVTSACGLQGILLIDPLLFGEPKSFDFNSTEVTAAKIMSAIGQDISAHTGVKSLRLTSIKELAGLKDLPETKRREIFVSGSVDRIDRNFDGADGVASNLDRFCQDRYVLLPNLEKNKHGVFGNENGRALLLKAGGWFFGGVVGGGNATDEQAISGKNIATYGPRIVSCVRTSDQRGQDAGAWFGDRFGAPECISWLKLSEPTATSIAQALISGEGRRVFRTKPNQPGDRIESLLISGVDVFGTKPVEVSFSPHLNALVGGRGSGKSLVLSALVRLFGVDKDWVSKEERTIWEQRHLSLFAEDGPFASPDVVLTVEYSKESGVRYRLTLESPGEPLMEHIRLDMWAGSGWTKIAEGDAVYTSIDFRPLFFLQGQMSSMTGSRLDQYDLTRLIEGPIRDLRQTLRNELKGLSELVREGFQQKRQKVQLEGKTKQLGAQVQQKEAERNAFLEAAKKGLTEDQQKLFEEAETYRKGKVAAQTLEDGISGAGSALDNDITDLESSTSTTLEAIEKLQGSAAGKFKSDAYLTKLIETSSRLAKELKATKKQLDADMVTIAEKKSDFLGEIDSVITKASESADKEKSRRDAILKAALLEKDIAELNKQKAAAEQDVQKIVRAGKIALAEEALVKFKEVIKRYSREFKERADKISANPEFRLVVRVIPGGLYQVFVDEMKRVCQGCGVREKAWNELDTMLQNSSDPAATMTDLIAAIISSYADPENAALPSIWKECGFSEAIYKNVLARTRMEDWVELSVILADDKVDVRYKKGSKKPPIPILSASPGERAVELLKLALFSTKGPLVIDQPEDDLDNHFLADKLVELVHQSKHANQLVFSSHNANLVVHGDTELVHVMDVTEVGEGKIGCTLVDSGTIDQREICLAVEQVMEGGRAAFEYRRRKYHETIDPNRT